MLIPTAFTVGPVVAFIAPTFACLIANVLDAEKLIVGAVRMETGKAMTNKVLVEVSTNPEPNVSLATVAAHRNRYRWQKEISGPIGRISGLGGAALTPVGTPAVTRMSAPVIQQCCVLDSAALQSKVTW